jgi:hypothetical protein
MICSIKGVVRIHDFLVCIRILIRICISMGFIRGSGSSYTCLSLIDHDLGSLKTCSSGVSGSAKLDIRISGILVGDPYPPPPPMHTSYRMKTTGNIPTRLMVEAVLRIRILDPGSGAFLTPGSGIGFFRIPDLGSRIPPDMFES